MTRKAPAPAKKAPAKKTTPAKKPAAVVKKPAPKATPKPGTSSAESRKTAFAHAYVANGGNATDAAKTAGYSVVTAASQGSRLLKDVKVREIVEASAKETANKHALTADLVVRSIVQEITFDPGCLYREDGSLKDLNELSVDERMALAGVEFATEGNAKDGFTYVRKIKWAPKAAAREQAMKHLGMFDADNRQRNPLGSGAPLELVQMFKQALEIRLQQMGHKPISIGSGR